MGNAITFRSNDNKQKLAVLWVAGRQWLDIEQSPKTVGDKIGSAVWTILSAASANSRLHFIHLAR
jgi:hypothetical protein